MSMKIRGELPSKPALDYSEERHLSFLQTKLHFLLQFSHEPVLQGR